MARTGQHSTGRHSTTRRTNAGSRRTSSTRSGGSSYRPRRSAPPSRSRGKSVAGLIVLIVVAVALAIGVFTLLNRCSSHEVSSPGAQYVSPYDFSGLEQINGRFVYREGGAVRSLTGIDVSSHEGVIDWNAVAADDIDFAIIRLGRRGTTEGGIYLDDNYRANVEGATQAGIPVGVYFFSQAVNEEEAVEEAQFVVDNLAGVALSYPVVFDEEIIDADSRAHGLSREQLTANARAFCDYLQDAGIPVMIYGNQYDIGHLDLSQLSDIPIWYAQYSSEPEGQFDFCIWQYSEEGTVAGISSAVDLNIRFTNSAAEDMFAKA